MRDGELPGLVVPPGGQEHPDPFPRAGGCQGCLGGCLFGVPGAGCAGRVGVAGEGAGGRVAGEGVASQGQDAVGVAAGGGVVDESLHEGGGVGGVRQGEAPLGVLDGEVGQGGVVQGLHGAQDAVLVVQALADDGKDGVGVAVQDGEAPSGVPHGEVVWPSGCGGLLQQGPILRDAGLTEGVGVAVDVNLEDVLLTGEHEGVEPTPEAAAGLGVQAVGDPGGDLGVQVQEPVDLVALDAGGVVGAQDRTDGQRQGPFDHLEQIGRGARGPVGEQQYQRFGVGAVGVGLPVVVEPPPGRQNGLDLGPQRGQVVGGCDVCAGQQLTDPGDLPNGVAQQVPQGGGVQAVQPHLDRVRPARVLLARKGGGGVGAVGDDDRDHVLAHRPAHPDRAVAPPRRPSEAHMVGLAAEDLGADLAPHGAKEDTASTGVRAAPGDRHGVRQTGQVLHAHHERDAYHGACGDVTPERCPHRQRRRRPAGGVGAADGW